MKISGAQIISELRDKLRVESGRHLYGILGTYAQLTGFEQNALAQAKMTAGSPLPTPVNTNRELLAQMGDDDLLQLARDEAKRPQAIQRKLNGELGALVASRLRSQDVLILKQLELVFAYALELSVFRTHATDKNHVILLLPGERRSDRIILFSEAESRFQRTLPENLIAENHLWELTD